MSSHSWLFWTCLGITLTLCIVLFCFSKVARKVPLNYISLFVFTILTSYLLASICIFQSPDNVMIAAALTLTVFVSLTVLTLFVKILSFIIMQTNFELTVLSGLLSILCHVLIVLIPMFIVFRGKWIFILVCCVVIILISIFLIYDTQVIWLLSLKLLKISN